MIRTISHWLRMHIGLVGIIAVLLVITGTSVQPGLYLIGWDNYSSYLGGTDSLFRTFFSVWRSYRGIGVPGDSESTDIFRQLFLLIISPFVSEPMRDQIYILLCLWLGVLAVYAVSVRVVRRIGVRTHGIVVDLAGSAAAGAYLFNLHTVSTFYFPIITYITRFAAIPMVLWAADRYLYDERIGRVSRIGLVALIFFAAGSAITATVFLTSMVLLFGVVLASGRWRRGLGMLVLVVGLNAFWLFPFGQYAVEKSQSLRLAPVFIDTNEIQLNQSPETYSLWKQVTMYPNFFYTRYTEIDTDRSVPLYPATTVIDSPLGQLIIGIAPVLAIIGMVGIIIRPRKHYRLYWIPAIYGLFVVLSSQEQSILGFIPAFLNRIPYFQVVFRFGDTKFHPYIAVTTALAVGICIVLITDLWKRSALRLAVSVFFVLLGVGVPLVTIFRPMTSGEFLPPHLFTYIPDAYRDAARVIGSSPEQGRLLHLPYDPKLYWRSHAWGYMGSAFFQYMIPVPYIDKTFEPASLETTDLFAELTDILKDANQTTGSGLEQRAELLGSFLRTKGISWVLFDESVTPEVRIRNMRYWGTYNTTDTETLLKVLEKTGEIERVQDAPIHLSSIAAIYSGKLNVRPQEPLGSPRLVLYRVRDIAPMLSFVPEVTAVDAGLTRMSVFPGAGSVRQAEGETGNVLYPLLYKNAQASPQASGIRLSLPVQLAGQPEQGSVVVSDGAGDVVEVRAAIDASGSFTLSLYAVEAPDMGSGAVYAPMGTVTVPRGYTIPQDGAVSASSYLANWHVLPHDRYGDIRVSIGGTVLPVPDLMPGQEYILGSVLTGQADINVSIYKKKNQISLDPGAFTLTDNPNCFGDRMTDYKYGLLHSDTDAVTLTSVNGSTCMVYPVTMGKSPHTELNLAYRASALDVPSDEPTTQYMQSDGIAAGLAGLGKPNQLSICLAGGSDDRCLNTHQMLRLAPADTVVLPTEADGGDLRYIRLALVPVGLQHQSVTLSGNITEFEMLKTATVAVPARSGRIAYRLPEGGVSVTLPYVLSRGAFMSSARDGWYVSNRPCETVGGYRTTLQSGNGVISALSDCYNELSTPLPFDSRFSRLWAVSYAVFSGKQPTVMLGDPFGQYVSEHLSLYQGYPSVPGMYALAAPQQWYRPYTGGMVRTILERQIPAWSHVVVPAAPELTDTRRKSYTIHQDSKNTGIFGVYGTVIMELPEAWRTMTVEAGKGTTRTYAPLSVRSYVGLLPSVAKVTIDRHGQTGNGLLLHRIAYDKNWRAYPSGIAAVLGYGGVVSDRCDGIFVCYVLPDSSDTWYLVYAPERLAIIGWIAVISISLIFVFSRRNRSRPSNT